MTRLTDEELDGAIKTWTGNGSFVERVLIELRERRAADRELARLANVCRGFYHRNVEWPRGGVRNLLDEIDKLLEATER